jgi:hypothetical protein
MRTAVLDIEREKNKGLLMKASSRENITVNMLGRAKRVFITKDDTLIVDGAGKKTEIPPGKLCHRLLLARS